MATVLCLFRWFRAGDAKANISGPLVHQIRFKKELLAPFHSIKQTIKLASVAVDGGTSNATDIVFVGEMFTDSRKGLRTTEWRLIAPEPDTRRLFNGRRQQGKCH